MDASIDGVRERLDMIDEPVPPTWEEVWSLFNEYGITLVVGDAPERWYARDD